MKYFFFIYLDLQLNQEFIQHQYFAEGDEVYSFSLPSQTCIVLQFDQGRMCKSPLLHMKDTEYMKQNLTTIKSHILLRQDTAYLYPAPMYSSSLSHLLHKNKKKKHYKMYGTHNLLWLTYVHWKTFEMHQTFQGELQMQANAKAVYDKCLISVETPAIFVPLKVSTKVTLLPSVNEVNNEKSFIFDGTTEMSWNMFSSSWVSSIMYLVNCSWHQIDISKAFNLPINEILQMCTFSSTVLIQWDICISCPKLININESGAFMLSISFSKVPSLRLNSQVGKLEVSNVWKRFCGHLSIPNSVYFLYDHWILGKTFTSLPIKCAELITIFDLHSNLFINNNTYHIEINVAHFQYAELQLFEYFLNLTTEKNIVM